MIFATSLPRFKAFLGNSCRQASDRTCCLLLLCSFILPTARRSVAAASRAILADCRDASWLLCWLGASKAPAALLAAAQFQLETAARRPAQGLHVLAIDSTQHGQQGQKTQNTFARGNTQPRPKQSDRQQQQVH